MMSVVSKTEAVKSAGERLEAIEAWSRRTFIAQVVTAVLTGVVAMVGLGAAFEYTRLKLAAQDAANRFQSEMHERFKAPPSASPTLPRRP